MTVYHDLTEWLSWIDELSDHDYVVIDGFIKEEDYQCIRSFLFKKLDDFKLAGIGSAGQHVLKRGIRGDLTYWLNDNIDVELMGFWKLLSETKQVLNRYCYLSLSGHEFHLAHYPPGGHYARHLDQFEGRNNRLISMIVYLNQNWQKGDGGELEILQKNGNLLLIEPLAKRCVLFKSAEVPHAVLTAHKNRYSLTGWFTYLPSNLGWKAGI